MDYSYQGRQRSKLDNVICITVHERKKRIKHHNTRYSFKQFCPSVAYSHQLMCVRIAHYRSLKHKNKIKEPFIIGITKNIESTDIIEKPVKRNNNEDKNNKYKFESVRVIFS